MEDEGEGDGDDDDGVGCERKGEEAVGGVREGEE